MNENNVYQEIDFFDMISALLKKAKLIICLTLVLALVGGGLGVFRAILANNSYGTNAEFYVYSDKGNNHILSLIKSDSFAENLLLDEYGLPDAYKDTDEYKQAYEATLKVVAAREELELLQDAVEEYPIKVNEAQRKASEAKTIYDEIYNMLSMYKASDASVLIGEALYKHNAKIAELAKNGGADK